MVVQSPPPNDIAAPGQAAPATQPTLDVEQTPATGHRPSNLLNRYYTQVRIALAAAAVAMVPWIIRVYTSEPRHALAYNLPVLRFSMTVFLAAGVAVTAWALYARRPLAILAGSSAATLAVVMAWFATVPAPSPRVWHAVVFDVIVFAPLALLSVYAVYRSIQHAPPSMIHRLRVLLTIAATVLIPVAVAAAAASSPTQTDIHQRLLWTGLDTAELAALIAVFVTTKVRVRYLPVAAVVAATLFAADAWYDTVGSAGSPHSSAPLYLPAEIIGTALLLTIAYLATRSSYRLPTHGPESQLTLVPEAEVPVELEPEPLSGPQER